jgi:hypothetical protein
MVDDFDYEHLLHYKWHAHFNRPTRSFIAQRHVKGIRLPDGRWHNISETMQEHLLGKVPGFQIDHRDTDTLNNQRDNLRHATSTENSQNRSRPNQTGFKGVFRNDMGRYTVRITKNKQRITLGTFLTPEEAARAYNHGARQFFGEFARLNPV